MFEYLEPPVKIDYIIVAIHYYLDEHLYLTNYFDLKSSFEIIVNCCCFLELLGSCSCQLEVEQFTTVAVTSSITNYNYFENDRFDYSDLLHYQIDHTEFVLGSH